MMAAPKEIGVVVVGLGIAGGVRIRDLQEKLCGLALRGVVSRRPVNLPDVPSLTMDEALSRQDVNAVIVCTENKTHEEFVQRGLENGKHVLVEYPVALSSSKAREFYDLAVKKGLVLWEENIALLTDTHQQVKMKAGQVGIKSAIYSVTGSYNGWIENFEESGLPFTSGVSGIETLVDLFGDLKVVSGKMDTGQDDYTATAGLETSNQRPISITLARCKSKEAKRKKSVVYEFEDGEVIDLDKIPRQPPTKPGLFMKDMLGFYQAILDGKNNLAVQEQSIKSLEIAENIHALFGSTGAQL